MLSLQRRGLGLELELSSISYFIITSTTLALSYRLLYFSRALILGPTSPISPISLHRYRLMVFPIRQSDMLRKHAAVFMRLQGCRIRPLPSICSWSNGVLSVMDCPGRAVRAGWSDRRGSLSLFQYTKRAGARLPINRLSCFSDCRYWPVEILVPFCCPPPVETPSIEIRPRRAHGQSLAYAQQTKRVHALNNHVE